MPAIVLPRRAEGESRLDETERCRRRVALAGGSGACRAYARGVAARGARCRRRRASSLLSHIAHSSTHASPSLSRTEVRLDPSVQASHVALAVLVKLACPLSGQG